MARDLHLFNDCLRHLPEALSHTELTEAEPENADEAFDRLHKLVTKRVMHLLQTDLNALMSILYRIDVPEHQVKLALATGIGDNTASILADLIIMREVQKAETRRRYS